jgi:hypothetical protein
MDIFNETEVFDEVKMTPKQIAEEFQGRSLRAEVIIHIGSMLADEWPESAKDAFSYDWDEVFLDLGLKNEAEVGLEWDEYEEISEFLYNNGIFGFLVQFATPIPEDFTAYGHSGSWGYYTMKWIYAETYEDACVAAMKWQDEYIEKKRAQQKKKGAAWGKINSDGSLHTHRAGTTKRTESLSDGKSTLFSWSTDRGIFKASSQEAEMKAEDTEAAPHGPISGELHALGLEVKSLTERVGNKDLRKIIGIGNNLFALAERVAALEQMPLETL